MPRLLKWMLLLDFLAIFYMSFILLLLHILFISSSWFYYLFLDLCSGHFFDLFLPKCHLFLLSNVLQKLQISPHFNVHMAINKCITFLFLWNLSCHYLHNHSVDMLGYSNVIWCKEHSPKVWQIPVGALGIWPLSNLKRLEKWVHWCHLDSKTLLCSCFHARSSCLTVLELCPILYVRE